MLRLVCNTASEILVGVSFLLVSCTWMGLVVAQCA